MKKRVIHFGKKIHHKKKYSMLLKNRSTHVSKIPHHVENCEPQVMNCELRVRNQCSPS